ncbi:WS/DGAT/MGAT family O-acyltransferase [Mycobacteroides abscessus subsp. abscessus]
MMAGMPFMPVSDSMFLIGETREHPFHVGGLQLFKPPVDAGPDYAEVFYEQLMSTTEVSSDFRKRPGQPLAVMGNLTWIVDDEVDWEYHVRRSALPRPARVRELLTVTSRWHSSPLDRHRPLWEMHVVEGLSDGRLAVYTKMHHAVIDGVGALRMMMRSLSDDPDARDCQAVWAPAKRRAKSSIVSTTNTSAIDLVKGAVGAVRQVVSIPPGLLKYGRHALSDPQLVKPLSAPHTMLNVSIGGARRFAAQTWSMARIKEAGKALGGTVNDVVLAMCGGALRTYLEEQNALPDKPLVAMCPVSIRAEGDQNAGNSITALLANLATDKPDPLERFSAIRDSVQAAKSVLSEMTPLQRMLVGALNGAPVLTGAVPGLVDRTAPAFNVIISNVPGPRTDMFWNGFEMDGCYPASIPIDGVALNITCTSSGSSMHFGLTGCRTSVPHLQRILAHLEDALTQLEESVA